MSYARVFLRGWSRREWLTVVVVAITAAFLLGTALLLASAGAYTETLEDDLSGTATATEYDSLSAARDAAGPNDVVVPLATAEVDGRPVTVAGIPQNAPSVLSGASVEWRQARFPNVQQGPVGPVGESRSVRFVGERGTVETTVRPGAAGDGEAETILPPWWYATDVRTIERLGPSTAIVFDPDGGTAGAVPTGREAPPGTPLIAALPFLLAGVRELLTVLSVAAIGGGVLVLVVVYSVTRMAIRDRYDDIRIVRSTGGSPRRLLAILCGRAAGLVVTGVALGYALAVVLTNAVTNVAVVAGFPVTLAGRVTPAVARLLALLAGVLLLAGLVAGVLAALPAVRTPPAQLRSRTRSPARSSSSPFAGARSKLTDGGGPNESRRGKKANTSSDGASSRRGRTDDQRGWAGRLGRLLRPTVLDARAAIPTTATLAVFVFVVLLIGALWGAFVPLTATGSGTIVEAGAAHPLNSRVDASSAELLRSQGINASAEVLYAAVTDGQPYLARGADYRAFASVSDARLVAGREPRTVDEAVIGRDLARTLDVEPGETILLGGSVTPGVRRVTVVGVFAAGGTLDDVLVVPLDGVQDLAVGGNQAHIIRTENLSAAQSELLADGRGGVVVTSVRAPETVGQGDRFNVLVSVRNLDDARASTTVVTRAVGTDGGERTVLTRQSVTLGPGSEETLTVATSFETPGTRRIGAGGSNTTIQVVDPRAFTIPGEVPGDAPPGATLLVPAAVPNGSFVPNATVTIDGRSVRTGANGVARVTLPSEPGTYRLTVRKSGFSTASQELTIRAGASRQLSGQLRVQPQEGNALTKPRLETQVANPWGRELNRTLTLVTPGGRQSRTVELPPGGVTRLDVSATEAGLEERLPPGSYDLRLVSSSPDGEVTLATTTYRVRGDDRILSLVAREGSYAAGTPVGQAIENVFGNVQVLFGAIVFLAGLATVGGTTAAFAQAVHARSRTIGIRRATGATPRQVLQLLVVDACRIAVPSTLVALVIAGVALAVLDASGLLVVFGIQLAIPAVPWILAMAVGGAIVLSVVSVVVGAASFLRVSPGQLLRARE